MELRQSSKVSRFHAVADYTSSVSEIAITAAQNPELEENLFVVLANQDTSVFTPVEFAQVTLFLNATLNAYQGLFQSVHKGILSEDYLAIIQRSTHYTLTL